MKTSTFLGSALGVLLIFSVFSYAKAIIQEQDPKPAVKQQPVLDVAGQIPEADEAEAPAEKPSTATAEKPSTATAEKPAEENFAVPPATYSATAYSLRGRTASGMYVSRGLIAADPRHLPLGTRVRIEAGQDDVGPAADGEAEHEQPGRVGERRDHQVAGIRVGLEGGGDRQSHHLERAVGVNGSL